MSTHASGTNYNALDLVKRGASARAALTLAHARIFKKLGWQVLEWTRGESTMLIHHPETGMVLGEMLEGLGTENIIAENPELRALHRRTFYDACGWSNAATSFNDSIVLGALPITFGVHPAVEDGDHLAGENGDDLAEGTAQACEFAGALYTVGETPGLPGIITPGTMCLSGAGKSQVPGGMQNVINPAKLQPGDKIYMLASTGIHDNGFTGIRKEIHRLPDGYCTRLPDGRTFGMALLERTRIYVLFIERLQELGVHLSYAAHISGHGWAKLLRAPREDLTYLIKTVPEVPHLFRFIQELRQKTDRDMFSAYNMGQGFAAFARPEYDALVKQAAEDVNIPLIEVGIVESGKRIVYIKPLDIVFTPKDADIR